MISLTVIILLFILIFGSIYLIYKMNKQELKPARHRQRRHHGRHSRLKT